MEGQRESYDVITVMKGYNFHKPISVSVIVEDNEKEPIQSKASDYEKNNVMYPVSQNNCQYKNCSMQRQNSYMRNEPKNSPEIRPAHTLGANGSKRNVNQRYLPGNIIANTTPCTDNTRSCSGSVIKNNCSKPKSPVLHNSQKSETILINKMAENLALIMEAYVHYCTLIAKSKDRQYITHLRGECLRVKLNLFHKCLAISEDVLLQYETNQKLIKEILLKTKQISKVTLPSKHYEHLYEDLLKWIRLKKYDAVKNTCQNTRRNESLSADLISRASNIVPKPIPENRPATNIFSSGPPDSQVTISIDPKILEQQRISQNIPNSTTTYLQRNSSDTQHFPYSNYSYTYENNQQNKISSMSHSTTMSCTTYYDNCLMTQQNNNCNTMYMPINQTESQDIIRSSISRDSGFISPVMSVSPSEYYTNNIQHQSAESEEQRNLNFGIPNLTASRPNVTNERFSWNHV